MNIWLPTITNLIIFIILCTGTMIGVKRGFWCQFIKFILALGICVGCYFLTPVISTNLLKIEALYNFNQLMGNLHPLVFLVLFLIFYTLIAIITNSIFNHLMYKNSRYNGIKRVKIKSNSRKEARELRRQARIAKRRDRIAKKLSTTSKIFGGIFGFLISFLIGFIIMTPFKYAIDKVVSIQPELTQISSAYDYTPYGQLDKCTNISDILNHVEE